MINILHIRNIGIIDDISIDFNKGLNVLTGETGAGKTLIIDALNIISGGRFSKEMIRKGEEYSFVEAQISLENNSDNIIISREINSSGKNTCKIDGRLVTVAQLRDFMKNNIDIHGQNDNQNLLNISKQILYVDAFSGEELANLKSKYKIKYEEYINLRNELSSNYGDEKEKQRKLDLLKYQYNEIEKAQLKIGEDSNLEQQIKLINNSEQVYINLNEANEKIEQNAIDAVNSAVRNIEKIEEYNISYKNIADTLRSIYYDLQEIKVDMQNSYNEIYFDEEKKLEVNERLDIIYSLKRKYGNTIEEILKYKEQVEKEINKIEGLEEYINNLKRCKKIIEDEMLEICIKLNNIRKENSKVLEQKINKELEDLEMKNATIYINIQFNENKEFNKNGLDDIEFLIRTNLGEDKKSLCKIASGGETSRIMLAIKTVLANVDNTPTLIFDEIDTGISGIAADMVGEKLKLIAKNHQILIVTHLANIAAKGDYNYFIHKEIQDKKTKTKVNLLKGNEILEEIARIASGKITKVSLEHARELRDAKIA